MVLAVLGAQRALSLRNGSISSTAGSESERWLPLLFAALISVWFVISGLLNRAPRHLLAGLVAAGGADAGPLMGLAWRDSLALAAVTGLVLIADGGIARRQTCHPS